MAWTWRCSALQSVIDCLTKTLVGNGWYADRLDAGGIKVAHIGKQIGRCFPEVPILAEVQDGRCFLCIGNRRGAEGKESFASQNFRCIKPHLR